MDPRSTIRRRAALTGLATAALVALQPPAAQAHAILEGSSPPIGGSVKAGAVTLRLRFNSRIDHRRSRLTLTAPDGHQRIVTMDRGSAPDIINAHLDLKPGAYTLRWLVLAVDGHITRGDVPFTVTGP